MTKQWHNSDNAVDTNPPPIIEGEKKITVTRCYAREFFEICARATRGEVWLYSIEVGNDNAEWICEWGERNDATAKNSQAR